MSTKREKKCNIKNSYFYKRDPKDRKTFTLKFFDYLP